MEQRDYLLRQIEQLLKALKKILTTILKIKNLDEFEKYDILKEEIFQELRINIDDLVLQNNEKFLKIVEIHLLKNTLLYDKFSEILFETAKFYNINIEKRKQYYSKSLLLLKEVVTKTKTFSLSLNDRIEFLNKKIREINHDNYRLS